ncbi:transcriptional regulator LrhA [Bordetella trematum]|uniref:LysR substrate-binding domain-containing protein n=1 Tax=Bordetella trematum TaxID=123899 RepID=UPI0004720C8D|nr:LysR substrate-binding domain-containing protein [Bordetella trematum]AUL45974.1 transcriptional regulator LrhA [Bordetella trematum]
MRNLDLELLRSLVAVDQFETFAAAAEQLHKTQSAVSQQLQRLEALIGFPLFEKRGRRKHLSAHGQRLLAYAHHLLAINDEAIRAMQDASFEGKLRLGAPHDVADSILPTVLNQVTRFLPKIKLEIRVDRSPVLMTAMHSGEIDLCISTRFDQTLEGLVLRSSPTVWFCSADYVHDPGSPLPLVLADEPSIFRRLALTALEQARIPWHANYVAPNLVGIRAALRAGLGITARSVELHTPDMRVLGEGDGLPALPDVTYYLWIHPDPVDPSPRLVYDMLRNNLKLTQKAGRG